MLHKECTKPESANNLLALEVIKYLILVLTSAF